MHAHLVMCQIINEKKYLEERIEEAGKELLEQIRKENVEYDYLDERADTKLLFNRVFTMLGEKNIIFQIKEDQLEMAEVIEQFKHTHNSLIRNLVELLDKYYQDVVIKNDTLGYESEEGLRNSQKSKLKSSKYISRNSIRLSSHSINQDSESRKSSTGSEKQIRFYDDPFGKSAKALHTIDGTFLLIFRLFHYQTPGKRRLQLSLPRQKHNYWRSVCDESCWGREHQHRDFRGPEERTGNLQKD